MSLDQLKVELCSWWGGDRSAAQAAWASSTDLEKALARSDVDVARVVSGVAQNHHDTPKERIWMELFITCPLYTERQLDKYRMTVQGQDYEITWNEGAFGRWGITQNELSGRYRTIPDRPYTLPEDVLSIVHKENSDEWCLGLGYQDHLTKQHEWYQGALDDLKNAQRADKITNAEYKRAREVLRGVLGTAFMTDMRLVMNLNALEHVVNQRLPQDAQLESRYVAALMLQAVIDGEVAPVLINEMIWANGWDKLLEGL